MFFFLFFITISFLFLFIVLLLFIIFSIFIIPSTVFLFLFPFFFLSFFFFFFFFENKRSGLLVSKAYQYQNTILFITIIPFMFMLSQRDCLRQLVKYKTSQVWNKDIWMYLDRIFGIAGKTAVLNKENLYFYKKVSLHFEHE